MAHTPDHQSPEVVASTLRRQNDELASLRAELVRARQDLVAMEQRFADVEAKARLGIAADRVVANTEFLQRQSRALERHNRLLRLVRPFRGSRFFAPLERTARRIRANRSK